MDDIPLYVVFLPLVLSVVASSNTQQLTEINDESLKQQLLLVFRFRSQGLLFLQCIFLSRDDIIVYFCSGKRCRGNIVNIFVIIKMNYPTV